MESPKDYEAIAKAEPINITPCCLALIVMVIIAGGMLGGALTRWLLG